MEHVVYLVRAEHPSEASASEYVSWLLGSSESGEQGHAAEVVAAGALRAEVVVPEDAPRTVECRYTFPNLSEFRRYESDHAPRLRAEGLRRFGPERGIRFVRSISRVAGVVLGGSCFGGGKVAREEESA